MANQVVEAISKKLDQINNCPVNGNYIDIANEQVNAAFSRPENLEEHRQCALLLRVALKGDWAAANPFLKNKSDCLRARITKEEATTLHIAATAGHTAFVEELLKLMELIQPEDMELKTNYGFTVLHSAAQSGNVRIAMQLVKINNELLLKTCDMANAPLIVATYLGHTSMVSYLFSETPLEKLIEEKRIELLHVTIYNDMYDIALKILERNPNIANASTECRRVAMEMLARKHFSIGSESASKDSLASYVIEDDKENMLHLVGKLVPSDRLNIVSGAALQMQRKLLWFKPSLYQVAIIKIYELLFF
ncbi:uncharacterized protein LOC132169299 [Corylus avellana]|uniref:uncharacterized protein LOC132169299 n=1 Tax=Corylus avellana TaxID=13451 RepID=UPI00286BAF65|nr:uncharacterized protein LOC132169299 [Corylus avellana]